jgi:hypothetical protein
MDWGTAAEICALCQSMKAGPAFGRGRKGPGGSRPQFRCLRLIHAKRPPQSGFVLTGNPGVIEEH